MNAKVVTAACCLLVVIVAVRCGAAEPEKQMGGHPLAGRHGGLAELLEQADWPAVRAPAVGDEPVPLHESQAAETPPRNEDSPEPLQRPVMKQIDPPSESVGPNGVSQEVRKIIAERHRIVDACDLFQTLGDILKEEPMLKERFNALQGADARVRAAAQRVNALRTQMMGAGLPEIRAAIQHQINDAMQVQQREDENRRRKFDEWKPQQQKVEDLYGRLQPQLKSWMRCYHELREYLPMDRQAPDRKAVLQILDAELIGRTDFLEGRVLAALAAAYDGNSAQVTRYLHQASDELDRYPPLSYTAIGEDFCRAVLAAGMPGELGAKVSTFIKKELEGRDIKQQTPVRTWLIASCCVQQDRNVDAKKFFERGLRKIDAYDEESDAVIDNPLIGDAAFFYLVSSSEQVRNPEKAEELLARTPSKGGCWEVVRAKAALAAEKGDWKKAVQLLDECAKRCPAALDTAVAAQRKAYEAERQWLLQERRKKPKGSGDDDQPG